MIVLYWRSVGLLRIWEGSTMRIADSTHRAPRRGNPRVQWMVDPAEIHTLLDNVVRSPLARLST
jgi:hypothetical protein